MTQTWMRAASAGLAAVGRGGTDATNSASLSRIVSDRQAHPNTKVAVFAAAGEPPTAGQRQGLTPGQILTRRDVTFDPTEGWKADPDFAEHVAQLWGAA